MTRPICLAVSFLLSGLACSLTCGLSVVRARFMRAVVAGLVGPTQVLMKLELVDG